MELQEEPPTLKEEPVLITPEGGSQVSSDDVSTNDVQNLRGANLRSGAKMVFKEELWPLTGRMAVRQLPCWFNIRPMVAPTASAGQRVTGQSVTAWRDTSALLPTAGPSASSVPSVL